MVNTNQVIRANKKFLGQGCSVCRREIELGDSIIVCPNCQGAAHESCWRSQGGCGNISCHSLTANRTNYNNGSYSNQTAQLRPQQNMYGQQQNMSMQQQNTYGQQPNMPRPQQNMYGQQPNMPRPQQNMYEQEPNVPRPDGQTYNSFPEQTGFAPYPQSRPTNNRFNQPGRPAPGGSRFQPNNSSTTNMVSCKWCKEPIKRGSITCPHCGKKQRGEESNKGFSLKNNDEPIGGYVWVVLFYQPLFAGVILVLVYLFRGQFINALKIFLMGILFIIIRSLFYFAVNSK